MVDDLQLCIMSFLVMVTLIEKILFQMDLFLLMWHQWFPVSNLLFGAHWIRSVFFSMNLLKWYLVLIRWSPFYFCNGGNTDIDLKRLNLFYRINYFDRKNFLHFFGNLFLAFYFLHKWQHWFWQKLSQNMDVNKFLYKNNYVVSFLEKNYKD